MLAAAVLGIACHNAAEPVELRLTVTAGDGQHARAGGVLPSDVVVQLRDGTKGPVAGATVTWRTATGSNDGLASASTTTDANGSARASWHLDTLPGNHVLSVTVPGAPALRLTAFADSDSSTILTVHGLRLASYDGSGQLVHPDFARVPDTWADGPFLLAATPFPRSQATLENPSLFSASAIPAFAVPTGVQNPLVRPDSGYLSDPDMVFDADAALLSLYYRKVTDENEIWLMRSADGVTWSTPVLTVHAPNHAIVSPTVVRRGPGEWLMWSVNAGVDGCTSASTSIELRRSSDGVAWSAPAPVALSDPAGFAWHIDVEWIASRNEYWALYPIKPAGNCATSALRLATSADGMTWRTYPSPVLPRGAFSPFYDIVYRGSLDHEPTDDGATMWYSGARLVDTSFEWSLAWERISDSALFARVNAPSAAIVGDRVAARPSVLTNATAP